MNAARNLVPSTPEERIARAIAAIRGDLEPDPLFQRRLRSQVLGRYVAAREGVTVDVARPRKEMGRLGRAVLYASFVLGVSVTSVMAASQQATPGDRLRPRKRDIEALRHRVLPAEFEQLLLRTELNARLDELASVAERGDAAALALLAAEVHESYGQAIELATVSPQNLAVLDALLDRLPQPARAALQDVIFEVDRATHPGARGRRDEAPAHGRDKGEAKPPAAAPPADAARPSTSEAVAPSASPESPASPSSRPSRAPSPSASPDDQRGDQSADQGQDE